MCGSKKENCVANQTLEDKKCLVPCEGLYADVAEDSLKQNVISLEQNVISLDHNVISLGHKGIDSVCIYDNFYYSMQ